MKPIAFILVVLVSIALRSPALADDWTTPTPQPPFHFDKTLAEKPSPTAFDLDAVWLRSLPFGDWIEAKDVPRFHCDGAVIIKIDVTGDGSLGPGRYVKVRTRVGLRRGDDRDITIRYFFMDGERVVGIGDVKKQNLDERYSATYETRIKISKADYALLTAEGAKPVLRVLLTIDDQD